MAARGRPKGSKDKTQRKTREYKPNPIGKRPSSVREAVEKNMKREDISKLVTESTRFYGKKAARTNEEISEGIIAYFQECSEKGIIPTVEEMALSLGVTRQTLYNWEIGVNVNKERAEMIKIAKETLAAIDAKLVSEGKIPQVTYIFRSKNYYGMRDQQEVVLTPNVESIGDNVDEEKLKQKYLESTYGVDGNEIVIEAPETKYLKSGTE